MTDITATPPLTRRLARSESETSALIRRRYRSESRFRFYGTLSLGITTVFVLSVLFNIVMQGLPAFWQHSMLVDVQLKPEAFDPKGTKDLAEIRKADYAGVASDALRAAIPGIEGRQPQRRLDGLLSSGAGDELRQTLLSSPSLVGSTARTRFLLSDDADLYFKGSETRIETKQGVGVGSVTGTSGEVKFFTSSNDFASALASVKAALGLRMVELNTQLRRSDLGSGSGSEELRKEIAELKARVEAPSVAELLDERLPSFLVAINGGVIKLTRIGNVDAEGVVILPLKAAEDATPGSWSLLTYARPESNRKLGDYEVTFLERLRSQGMIERHFNWRFLTSGDSREAELAGILGSLTGSILMLLVTIALSVPMGVLAAVYLEEFAPKNWLTDIIEININNLAAVPSIVFGLLGLAVFLNFFGLPRSAPLVGGLVLALLVLPTIIIAARAALKAVPPSIKEAALGVGASHQQAVFHHVLPLATPGIMTGTIIGMAHALGETAPLLMIGMLAFVVDIPQGLFDPSTALPAQIYIWSDLPEQAFQSKTAAAIMVLLVILFVMNGTAICLRKKFEKRW